jgi:NodT family efflux transporter outer membrane factor (OMF) lipoprotein
MIMSMRTLAVVLAGSALLAACANSAGLKPSAQAADPASLAAKDTLSLVPTKADSWPADDWWRAYGDTQLDTLIEEALAGSPTLAVAHARIEQADAAVRATRAMRWPQLGVAANADRQRYSENGLFPPPIAGATLTTGQLAANFSYQFDFWGKQRSALDAALSRARAAAIEGEAARLALAAAVAQTYVELDHQYALLDVAEASAKQREQIRELTGLRVKAGLETQVELRQSESSVFAARTNIGIANEHIALLRNALAALLGKGPDRGLTITRPHLGDGPAAKLPSDLPADLLGRRPDVVAQELRVEAAGGEIDAARASFYPNVDLTAFLGFQSIGLDQLLKNGSRTRGAGLALSLPIFDGGRLRANLAGRDADYDLAVQQYNATLVEALREVADQVNSWHAIDLQSADQAKAQAQAEEAYRLALMRYKGALSSYLTVLSVESQVLSQRRLAADLRARRLTTSIALNRALGGGFRDDERSANP